MPDQPAFDPEIKAEALTATPDSVGEKTNPVDWGEAPDVTAFYGRTVELATLEKWIVQDRCRLVAITGMGGIGKTALSVKLAQQTQADFEYVVWQSLRHGPPLKETLAKLLKFLSGQEKYLPEAVDEGVVRLIDVLREHRCLLVLDNLETILRSGTLAGQYREGYEGYGELLQRIGETPHQSCLAIATLEKPEAIASHAGEMLPVRTLQLEGLQVAEAGEIFRAKGLSDQDKWPKLVELYRGNPLELKIVATTIQELFSGRVAEFLQRLTLVFGGIRILLEQQFERLSDLEKEILYWLAIKSKPVSFLQLQADVWLPLSPPELLEALESLGRRSLIEKSPTGSQALFTLQPVVMEYVTQELIEEICAEIFAVIKTQKTDRLERLSSHALKTQEQEVKTIQAELILNSIKERLQRILRSERTVEEQLHKVLALLQSESPIEVGYASENIQNLLTKGLSSK